MTTGRSTEVAIEALAAEPLANRLNRYWRVAGTGFSFAVFGLGACALAAVLLLAIHPLPLSRPRKQRWTRQAISAGCRCYIRMMRLMGLLTYEYIDTGQLAAPGQLIVANHPSLLDVIFLMSLVPQANCVVKAALWKNPFTAGIVSLAGYVRNDSEALVERAAAIIREGQSLIVFPEGTRTPGSGEMRFKRGAANVALATGCVVTPVIIGCLPKTLQKHQKWYQVPPSPPLFRFRVLAPVSAGNQIDPDRPKSVQVRQFNRHLESLFRQNMGSVAKA